MLINSLETPRSCISPESAKFAAVTAGEIHYDERCESLKVDQNAVRKLKCRKDTPHPTTGVLFDDQEAVQVLAGCRDLQMVSPLELDKSTPNAYRSEPRPRHAV